MVIVLDPLDSANVPIEFVDIGSATIVSVTYSPIPGLTLTPISVSGNVVTVRVGGVAHGRAYQVEAQIALSSGETLNRNVTILGMNG